MQQGHTVLPVLLGPGALHRLFLLHLFLSMKLVSWSSPSSPEQKADLEEAHEGSFPVSQHCCITLDFRSRQLL